MKDRSNRPLSGLGAPKVKAKPVDTDPGLSFGMSYFDDIDTSNRIARRAAKREEQLKSEVKAAVANLKMADTGRVAALVPLVHGVIDVLLSDTMMHARIDNMLAAANPGKGRKLSNFCYLPLPAILAGDVGEIESMVKEAKQRVPLDFDTTSLKSLLGGGLK